VASPDGSASIWCWNPSCSARVWSGDWERGARGCVPYRRGEGYGRGSVVLVFFFSRKIRSCGHRKQSRAMPSTRAAAPMVARSGHRQAASACYGPACMSLHACMFVPHGASSSACKHRVSWLASQLDVVFFFLQNYKLANNLVTSIILDSFWFDLLL
jgi:hypothetical protein